MIALRRSPAMRLACLVLALGVHAAVAGAFIGGSAKEPAPPPEVEIEILAAVTSEATPVETPDIAADAMQASEASEAASGDVANMVSDIPEEVASIAPIETVTLAETPPREDVSEERQQQTITGTEAVERPEAAKPPASQPLTEVPSVEPVQQAAEIAPVEPPQMVPPVAIEMPQVAAEDAPKIAALTRPVEVVEEQPRAAEVELVKAVAKRKSLKEAQPKPAKSKSAAKPKAQRQMTAGSRQSKAAQREGKSTAKRSGGKIAGAAYRSIVQARINARKGALQPALRQGSKGYVVVSFSIGASGRVTSASVVKSSGSGTIDSAARAMVAATSFPPPPGGNFSARVPIMVK